MEYPHCPLNDLRQAATIFTHEPGVPSPALWLPDATVPFSHGQLLLLACLAWRRSWALPIMEASLPRGFLPTHHLSASPICHQWTNKTQTWEYWRDFFPCHHTWASSRNTRTSPSMSTIICVASISPVTVYCSVTHTARNQLKNQHRPQKWACIHVHPTIRAHHPARRDQGQGQVPTGQERPQVIEVSSHQWGNWD